MRIPGYGFLKWSFVLLIILAGCGRKEKLFTLMPASRTGIHFSNTLKFNKKFNVYTYRNYYNGGGVALGDVNNDGLVDIYLISNSGPNQLYLNEGNFHFKNVTKEAGVAGTHKWSTGATMADVNGDGLLDIYVCNSGDIKGDNRRNELFINQGVDKNGIPHFKEEAEKYGVADPGFSTQAAFFDYDGDGDLDLYVLNNSYRAIGSFNLRKVNRSLRDSLGGDRLYRNDGGHFTDVSKQAHIYGSVMGFGLGISVADFNRDGWMDMYISNDFFERDYLYINNRNGTFREVLPKDINSISAASMGSDVADINNDGYPDIYTTDMLPSQNSRVKTVTTFESWKNYEEDQKNHLYHQFTRNTLQLNNTPDNPDSASYKIVNFSEIGRLAGVDATDWSWGALLFDMNNDGYNDIFVSNGIYQDITNLDYLKHISRIDVIRSIVSGHTVNYKKLIDIIPSNPIPNVAFRNNGNLTFTNEAKAWGLAKPSFSNGAAYADLNNDGSLDLVVNNVNMPVFIYRNNATRLLKNNHYLELNLVGNPPNTNAIGAEVTLKNNGKLWYREEMLTRGFESSVSPRLHFGLGHETYIDTLLVRWPDGRITLKTNIKTDQILTLKQTGSMPAPRITPEKKKVKTVFTQIRSHLPVHYRHHEDSFDDFERNPMIYHMISTEGPKMCTGDVNGDGLTDFYIGGAKGFPGALFIQQKDGSFIQADKPLFEHDKISEDMGCTFFDANGDGYEDLYVASGSNEFPTSSSALGDRLYINDGKGNFHLSHGLLPNLYVSTSTVKAGDFNGDGKPDLFVGVRVKPFQYGIPASSHLLENEGHGHFKDVTEQVAPGLKHLGMVTDALWTDYDGDGKPDLIVVGQYMPITIFHNENGKLVNVTAKAGLGKTNGWWNTIAEGDFNGDGKPDYVVGNLGLNSRFKATVQKPLTMYVKDFNGNGIVNQVIAEYNGNKSYPVALLHDLVKQIPSLEKKYPTYASYRNQTIQDIFTPEQLKGAVIDRVYDFKTSVLMNNGNGTFTVKSLPLRAQFSPVYGLKVGDFNGDGHQDILIGGNLTNVKPQIGNYGASYGLLLEGDGKGDFKPVPPDKSGFMVRGQIRDFKIIKAPDGKPRLFVAMNNDSLKVFTVNEK